MHTDVENNGLSCHTGETHICNVTNCVSYFAMMEVKNRQWKIIFSFKFII